MRDLDKLRGHSTVPLQCECGWLGEPTGRCPDCGEWFIVDEEYQKLCQAFVDYLSGDE